MGVCQWQNLKKKHIENQRWFELAMILICFVCFNFKVILLAYHFDCSLNFKITVYWYGLTRFYRRQIMKTYLIFALFAAWNPPPQIVKGSVTIANSFVVIKQNFSFYRPNLMRTKWNQQTKCDWDICVFLLFLFFPRRFYVSFEFLIRKTQIRLHS